MCFLVQHKHEYESALKQIHQKVRPHGFCSPLCIIHACRESERSDPSVFFPSHAAKDQLEEQRERVLQAERLLLHTLGFDFNVEHPYKHLLHLAKRLNQSQDLPEDSSRSLTQVAWNFANDRYVYVP